MTAASGFISRCSRVEIDKGLSSNCSIAVFVSSTTTDVPAIAACSDMFEDCAPVTKTLAILMAIKNIRATIRSEEHTSELQSRFDIVCRLLLDKKKKKN